MATTEPNYRRAIHRVESALRPLRTLDRPTRFQAGPFVFLAEETRSESGNGRTIRVSSLQYVVKEVGTEVWPRKFPGRDPVSPAALETVLPSLERQIAARVTEIKRQRRFENERTQRQSSEQTQANLDF